jgi:hypothetical protein
MFKSIAWNDVSAAANGPIVHPSDEKWLWTAQWNDINGRKLKELCSELSSGLYCRLKWLSTDVSEVRTASIIRDDHVPVPRCPPQTPHRPTRTRTLRTAVWQAGTYQLRHGTDLGKPRIPPSDTIADLCANTRSRYLMNTKKYQSLGSDAWC